MRCRRSHWASPTSPCRSAALPRIAQRVTLTLGSTIRRDVSADDGTQTESVQVSSQALTLEPTQAPSRAILTALQMQHLPSNGGRVQALIWQMPGGQVEPECRGLSVSGQKGIFSNISLDGADYNSTFACGTGSIRGGSGSAPTFNMDALQEFQITRNIFAAEFGRTTGGVINMSTKSGTNQFHHSATYLLRDSSMTARDAFGNQALAGNQQFGATVGGPIAKDRTFFFFAPEFQVASKPVNVAYAALDQQNIRNTPGAQALLGVAPEETVDAFSDAQSVIGRVDHTLLRPDQHVHAVRRDAHARAERRGGERSVDGAEHLDAHDERQRRIRPSPTCGVARRCCRCRRCSPARG